MLRDVTIDSRYFGLIKRKRESEGGRGFAIAIIKQNEESRAGEIVDGGADAEEE